MSQFPSKCKQNNPNFDLVALQTLMKMESHIAERRGTPAWEKTQATVVDVMKKTLGIMVRRLQPYSDYDVCMNDPKEKWFIIHIVL